MAAIDDWRAAADQISNQKKNDYINSNQYVLDSINSQKDAELQGLANSNTSAINALNPVSYTHLTLPTITRV